MRFKKTFVIVIAFFITSAMFAESADNKNTNNSILKIDLPCQLDAMNAVGHGFFSSYAILSMNQSLAISTGLYSVFHYGMKKLHDTIPGRVNLALEYGLYYGGTALGLVVFGYWLNIINLRILRLFSSYFDSPISSQNRLISLLTH
jgi:hypothetical protein